MMQVLLVDDDEQRRSELRDVIRSEMEGLSVKIVEAGAVVPAKVALNQDIFDLLVVDLALPRRDSGEVVSQGGIELLTSLEESEIFNVPTQIMAITAHEDLHEAVATRLATRGIGLLRYDRANASWREQLAMSVRRFVAAKQVQNQRSREFQTDLAVVCALRDPELESLLRLPWNWRTSRFDHDSSVYHEGDAPKSADRLKIVAAAAPQMGMCAASVLAAKMITEFRPRYLATIGIAAGRESKTRIGDVLVADPSWDAGSGKWVLLNGEVQFQQAPQQLPLDNAIRESVRLLSADSSALSSIRAAWPAAKPAHELRVILGPMASTSAVIADGVTMNAIVAQQRDLIGLEMEIYGVFMAAALASEPRPSVFAMKSVVDFADPLKGDRDREYAAYTSSSALKLLVERYL